MADDPIRIILEGFGGQVRISPPIWPDKTLNVQPGDLSKIVPTGTGVYGLWDCGFNPFESAPIHEPTGGVIYFSDVNQEDFLALLRILQIREDVKEYAVFVGESEQPSEDRYLHQIRIVHRFALRYLFKAITDAEYDSFPEQDLTIPEVMWAFIESQKNIWGTQMGDDRISGKFGGDGEWAIEQLALGLMVENEYHGVYRIWSRAWLVTK